MNIYIKVFQIVHSKNHLQISDDVVVKGATFENGLLNIELERIIPEEKKPRSIKIK